MENRGITLPRRWSEKSDDDKAEDVINVVEFDHEANIITKLRLSRIYRPLGSSMANRVELNYDIHYNGSEITITVSKMRCSWGGTGTETLVRISLWEGYVEEDPWWVNPWEIDDTVKRLGVPKTSELIIDTIKSVIDYYLDWEAE
jgi:hypothetical protein